MAFDGITTRYLALELNETLAGGGISRIIQPEKDELLLTIKNNKNVFLLMMSASASLPLLYLTHEKKEAPASAPAFSMLLRKHLQGGRILSVHQPGLERIVDISVEHFDELGDRRQKHLIIELMGKYSNIIFTDDSYTIIDSIKRIPASVSSVREVLPGKAWFIPQTSQKENPLLADHGSFSETCERTKGPVSRAIVDAFTGISPTQAEEILYRSGTDPRKDYASLDEAERHALSDSFLGIMEMVKTGDFRPQIYLNEGMPVEFSGIPLTMYAHAPYSTEEAASASDMICRYYGAKAKATRIRQKSSDLRHAASNALDRINKKYALQEKQLKSTEKRDKYRIYGEMLNTWGYAAEPGAKELTCTNYYTDEPITVPLDPTLSVSENAQRYFARYNKLKRTSEALAVQIRETAEDREQLQAILASIDLAENEPDLTEIRREMADYGFVQRKSSEKKGARKAARSAPLRYLSSDGFEMLVGKNNYQNDELSFKIASSDDYWFHAKGIPGSHVIVRCAGQEVPDRTFEEAGSLAAYYSSGRKASKVEIDYTLRRNLRKTNGGKPGFVIYHTNYSLMAVPDISHLKKLE